MKSLRGHRHEVCSIAIHHTGALALTTSRDKTLRLWDLVKGRTTFQSKLEEEAEQVSFSPSGTKYALRSGKSVSVFQVSGTSQSCVALEHSRRVTSFCFGNRDDAIITGTEDGIIRAWNITDSGPPSIALELDGAHASRVKAFAIPNTYTVVHQHDEGKEDDGSTALPKPESTALATGNFPAFLASASSDGHVSVWKLHAAIEAAISSTSPIQDAAAFCMSSANTKARLTTLCALDSVDMMELKALELSVKKKGKKTNKKPADGIKGSKNRLNEKKSTETRMPRAKDTKTSKAEAPSTKVVVHGNDTVVSFLDETDFQREAKRKKKIEIQAMRMRSPGTKKKTKRRL